MSNLCDFKNFGVAIIFSFTLTIRTRKSWKALTINGTVRIFKAKTTIQTGIIVALQVTSSLSLIKN